VSLLPESPTRGLRLNAETPAADFASLYPPCNWIAAFAEMTEQWQAQGLASTEIRRGGAAECCRDLGCPQMLLYLLPKNGG
jgi:hypothetical protein